MQAASHSLRQSYLRDGFVLVRKVFTETAVASLADACDRLAALLEKRDMNELRAQTRRNESGDSVVDRLDPVSDLDARFADSLSNPVLMALIEDLMGEPVYRFKDKLIWKNPGISGYELHQDYTFWSHAGVPAECMLNATIAIDRADRTKGAIKVYPGLHDRHIPPASVSEGIFTPGAGVMPRKTLGTAAPLHAEMSPGDVLIFHSLTPHESDSNRSSEPRRVLMGSYSAARFGAIRDRFYAGYRASINARQPASGS